MQPCPPSAQMFPQSNQGYGNPMNQPYQPYPAYNQNIYQDNPLNYPKWLNDLQSSLL